MRISREVPHKIEKERKKKSKPILPVIKPAFLHPSSTYYFSPRWNQRVFFFFCWKTLFLLGTRNKGGQVTRGKVCDDGFLIFTGIQITVYNTRNRLVFLGPFSPRIKLSRYPVFPVFLIPKRTKRTKLSNVSSFDKHVAISSVPNSGFIRF